MKQIFCKIAAKMQPGIVQNIISRLASKTPKMFKILQLQAAGIAIVIAAVIEALETHQVPDFKYEAIVLVILKFLAAVIAGIAASCSLHTEDSSLHQQTNAMDITHSAGPIGPPQE